MTCYGHLTDQRHSDLEILSQSNVVATVGKEIASVRMCPYDMGDSPGGAKLHQGVTACM